MSETRHCGYCKRELHDRRRTVRFCSVTCRVRAYRERAEAVGDKNFDWGSLATRDLRGNVTQGLRDRHRAPGGVDA